MAEDKNTHGAIAMLQSFFSKKENAEALNAEIEKLRAAKAKAEKSREAILAKYGKGKKQSAQLSSRVVKRLMRELRRIKKNVRL